MCLYICCTDARITPKSLVALQVLYERGRISPASQSLLNSIASAVIKEALIPKKEFPDAEGTIKMVCVRTVRLLLFRRPTRFV
uniref:Uncharacterized protein n=1 Tax=Parascaris equorum TaxID=6256 RepID=A0A914RGN4_PAREQ